MVDRKSIQPWVVVIAGGDFAIREIAPTELLPPDVLAFHPDRRSAELALERVLAFHLAVQEQMRGSVERETKLRASIAALPNADCHPDLVSKPLMASLAFQAELANRNLAALIEIAQPRKQPA